MVTLQKNIIALDDPTIDGSSLPNLNDLNKTVHCFENRRNEFAGSQSMKRRLPNIVHNAGSLRGLVHQYREEARLALHEARRARQRGAEKDFVTCMQAVRAARCKARKCSSFANLCEKRAKTIDSLMQAAVQGL